MQGQPMYLSFGLLGHHIKFSITVGADDDKAEVAGIGGGSTHNFERLVVDEEVFYEEPQDRFGFIPTRSRKGNNNVC